MSDHILKKFDDELNKLRYRLVKMGTIVQQQIGIACSSLLQNNQELAKNVIQLEKKVNKLDNKINNQCIKIIALHQPVASDLRLILVAYQMNIYLETIGDMTMYIIEDIINLTLPGGMIEKTKIQQIANSVDLMIGKLMDAFVDMNYDLAIDTIKMSDEIEILFNENFRLLNSLMKQNADYIEAASYMIDINRNFLAISQQTRSIAQELVFMIDSRIVKHQKIDKFINLANEEDQQKEMAE